MKLILVKYSSSLVRKLIRKIMNICTATAIILLIAVAVFLLGMLYFVGIEGRDALEQVFCN